MTGQQYQQPPQQAPQQPYYPPPPQNIGMMHAGIIDRFIALIIDGIIVCIVGWILLAIIGAIGFALGGWVGSLLSIAVISIILALYSPIMESMPKGATIGKMVMHIRVVDEQYRPVGFVTALIRNLSKFLWWTVIIFIIDVILVLSNSNGQHLGDSFANCYVVKEQTQAYMPQQQPQYQAPPPPPPPPQG